MNPPKNDFRQWVVYNPALKEDSQFYSLFKALENISSRDAFTCEKITDDAADLYRVIQQDNEATLLLSAEARIEMLRYLKTHYILSDDVEKWIATTEERAKPSLKSAGEEIPYFLDPRYNSSAHATINVAKATSQLSMDKPRPRQEELPAWTKWFVNPMTRKHALGYAIVALLISQIVLIPSNVFHVKLPEFFKYVLAVAFFVVHHFAVRNYRNSFLTGGIRYKTVWSITFWLYLTIFGVAGIELVLIDSVTDGSFGWTMLIVIPPLLIFSGLFMGWFFSLFIYYMNGGKVVTDPSTIKARS
jgi:hypothetical protein